MKKEKQRKATVAIIANTQSLEDQGTKIMSKCLEYRDELGDIKMEIGELQIVIGSGRIQEEFKAIRDESKCQDPRSMYREVCGMPPFTDQEQKKWMDQMIEKGETFNEQDYGKEFEHQLDQKFSRSKILKPKVKPPEIRSKSVVPIRKKPNKVAPAVPERRSRLSNKRNTNT